MGFRVVDRRQISRHTVDAVEEARQLVVHGFDRRSALRAVGFTGMVLPMFIYGRSARAFFPIIITGLVVPAVRLGTYIVATLYVVNQSSDAFAGSATVQHQEPSGTISEQDRLRLWMDGGEEQTLVHDGFTGREIGANYYIGRTPESREDEEFEVY